MKQNNKNALTAVRLPEGVRDFLPRAAARRQLISTTLTDVFHRFGYEMIRTPVFEVAEVLERGLGADARNSTIRFVEPGTGEEVALRPDITPQVARMAATRFASDDGPTRLCYQGLVVRSQRGMQGQKEVLQAGAELFGVGGITADVEAVALAAATLEATGIEDRRLEIGHVALVRWALSQFPDEESRNELNVALSQKDRCRVQDLSTRVANKEARQLIASLPRLYGAPEDVLGVLESMTLPPELIQPAAYLRELVERLSTLFGSDLTNTLTMDLGDARGFDYYTGIRLFGYLTGVGTAVLVGGRYDTLTKSYGREMPSIGFAVDVERVAIAEGDTTAVEPRNPTGVLVCGDFARSAVVASSLRRGGMRAAAQLDDVVGQKQLTAYAQRCGFRDVLLLGTGTSELLGAGPVAEALVKAAESGNGAELVRYFEKRKK